MSDLGWLTDYNAWSAKARVWGPIAAVVAFLFFLLVGWGWFLALVLALLVLVAVVWFTREGTAGADPWVAPAAPAPPPPIVPTPAPVEPVVEAAAEVAAAEVVADSEAAASERVRAAARAAGEAARLMDAPLETVRPAGLEEPRGGLADDLKKIKGVGPKLEALLNSLGYYHFDQIAGWSEHEIAWVDSNLEGFSGRVTRDNWVAQARLLAAGGATEFSERVERGEVYD